MPRTSPSEALFGQKVPTGALFRHVSLTDACEGYTRVIISVSPYQRLQSVETMMPANFAPVNSNRLISCHYSRHGNPGTQLQFRWRNLKSSRSAARSCASARSHLCVDGVATDPGARGADSADTDFGCCEALEQEWEAMIYSPAG